MWTIFSKKHFGVGRGVDYMKNLKQASRKTLKKMLAKSRKIMWTK